MTSLFVSLATKVVGRNYHRFESNGISKDLELASGQHPVALKCINLLGEHAPPPPSQESSLKCVWCPGIVCDLATPLLEGSCYCTSLYSGGYLAFMIKLDL